MASWLKRAEDLFEVVDRRAKLVVSELENEQGNIPPAATNGTGTQGRRSKPKGKKRAQKGENFKDRRAADSSSQPLLSDSIPEEIPPSSTVEKDRPYPETQPTSELVEKTKNNMVLDAALDDISPNEFVKGDTSQVEDASNAGKVVPSVPNGDLSSEVEAPSPDVVPSATSSATSTERSPDSQLKDPSESISVKDSDDSLPLGEDQSQSTSDETPSAVTTDSKMENHADVARNFFSNPTNPKGPKVNTNINKVEKQLDEAQGLLKSTSATGQSNEARLATTMPFYHWMPAYQFTMAQVCAGLSSCLQEYKPENAQLEELPQLKGS